MKTPEDSFMNGEYEEGDHKRYMDEMRRRELEEMPQMKIYRKYGNGIIDFIAGDKHQPVWSYTFRLTYKQTDGLLRYTWEHTLALVNKLNTLD